MILRKQLAFLFPLLLSGCFGADDEGFQGYVEGTYVYVSAETAGRLVERPVYAGGTVEAGAVVARLDDSEEKEAIAEAEARRAQAKAQLANLLSGQRDEEISVIASRLSEARANFNLAEEDYRRKLLLRERGTVSQSVVDDAKAKRDAASATVEGTERELIVAKLPRKRRSPRRRSSLKGGRWSHPRPAISKRLSTRPASG
jgi:HlyD family secretion protein